MAKELRYASENHKHTSCQVDNATVDAQQLAMAVQPLTHISATYKISEKSMVLDYGNTSYDIMADMSFVTVSAGGIRVSSAT